MYKLLTINGVPLPKPEGGFTITKKDKYNEYEGEDGSSTVEVIRQGILSLSVSYNYITEQHLKNVTDAIRLVSQVKVYDPAIRATRTLTAKITGLKTKMLYYKNDIFVWTLSFNLDEL